MCDPTLATVGINAFSTMSSINSQNEASLANAQNAKLAANNEYVQNTRQMIDQNRAILQNGMDLILQGREAESLAYTSAAGAGVRGASIRALMADKRFTMTRNKQRNRQEQEGLMNALQTSNEQARAKAEGRIASQPMTSFGLGDALGILAPIPKYGSKTLGINGLGD